MIKRPFLWGIGAFVMGILLAWYKIPLIFLVILAFVGWLLIYLFMFPLNKFINRKDIFLWSLPFLIFLGYFAMGEQMKPPDMDMAFREKEACSLTGEVNMIVKKPSGNVYYLKDNKVTLLEGSTYLVENILVYAKDSCEYLIGNQITVSGTIYKFSKNTNPGGFNENLYYKIQNIDYKVYAKEIDLADDNYSKYHFILNKIKRELINSYEKILPEKEAGILMAMVLGEKYLLGDEINSLYQENGISHILAISGLHISLVGAAVYFCLRKLRLGLIVSTLLSLIFIYSYGVLTNFSVSTNRAVVMYSVMLIAKIIGKTFDMLSALSLSAFIILLQNPMEIFNAGFLLSFAAVFGIALLVPCFNILFKSKKILLQSLYTSVCVQIFTLPAILYFFFQISIYSVIINLIILPLTSLLLLTAIVAGVFGFLFYPIAMFVAGGAKYILSFYEFVCTIGSKMPANLLTVGRPDIIRIVLYYLLILIFIYGVNRYKKRSFLLILLFAVGILIFPKQGEGLTVTMLDVGQGEAIYMETGEGLNFLIDGGSIDVNGVGIYRIRPFLLSKGINHIDYAIVTHGDTDHTSGLMELMEDGKIKIVNLILPKIDSSNNRWDREDITINDQDEFKDLKELAAKCKVNLMYIKAGDYIREGKLDITCLHPLEGYMYSSRNAYSTVLSVKYGDFDMLLTGDLEAEGERNITKMPLSQYDVLKVAHHGSKNSTSQEFLKIIKPRLSLISCGKDNRYGHPHEELLERLDDIGSELVITYESGAITIKTDGRRVFMKGYMA